MLPASTPPASTPHERVAEAFAAHRRALTTYLTRMVVREDLAEELVQEAAIRALEAEALPETPGELRAWLFRVATNLALDHLRRHSTWRETVLVDTKARAHVDVEFLATSTALRGSPETRSIAREHLAVCFACTLRSLEPHESAALLLKEVYDFTVEEVAKVMDASFGQAKAWIQSARARLTAKYAASCALVTQAGVCFQCVELDRFFGGNQGDPLAGTARDLDARLVVLRTKREASLGPWHRAMMRLVDEVVKEG
ncbi:RNA polymerase sigma-70 factor, ECF subfamily protein [Minicystis rosea]|nr:RNA polymerase sigma-70 factor, ECF subfamily protein [Minicystis rosea]